MIKNILIVFIFIPIISFTQILQWTAEYRGASNCTIHDVEVDTEGNTYAAGSYLGMVDLDPGVEELIFVANGSHDFFVQKLDVNGNLIWGHSFGGPEFDHVSALELLPDRSGVCITGIFRESVDFDPGDDEFILTSDVDAEFTADSYILKLNLDGEFIWAKSYGGIGGLQSREMAVDDAGNIYTTGTFKAVADFDPSDEVFELTVEHESAGFVQKLNYLGEFEWAIKLEAITPVVPNGLDVNEAGEVYVSGLHEEPFDADPSGGIEMLAHYGEKDIFVIKFDESGELIWGRSYGGTSSENIADIQLTEGGNLILTGSFALTVDFGTGVGGFEHISNGIMDVLVLSLNPDGSTEWVSTFESTNIGFGLASAINSLGNIAVVGTLLDTLMVPIDADTVFLISNGSNDNFFLMLSSTGIPYKAQAFGGTSIDKSSDVAIDQDNQVYIGGHFFETADLDPSADVEYNVTSEGSSDGFVIKLGQVSGLNEQGQTGQIIVYPNPTNGVLNIEMERRSRDIQLSIYDLRGQLVHMQKLSSINKLLITVDLNKLEAGLYYLNISNAELNRTQPFIKAD